MSGRRAAGTVQPFEQGKNDVEMDFLNRFLRCVKFAVAFIETLCQVVLPTLIGLLRGFGRNIPGHESLFLKLFDEKMSKSVPPEDTLSYKNLVTESMKIVAGVKVAHKKCE